MLDFQLKFFVILLVNFLALVWIMNRILFRPFLKIFKERQDKVNGDLESAKQMSAKTEEDIARIKKEFELARAKGKELFEGLRAEGLEKQKQALAAAHEEALARTEKIKGELAAEAEKARQTLRGEAEKFSSSIVEKLVSA
ncbi:MAG: ATP synthase F0 subunit B [Nitrospiraceae bacterium]|nr:ATP synthase F0 subunit B [Nitrospiraceae bacterium]